MGSIQSREGTLTLLFLADLLYKYEKTPEGAEKKFVERSKGVSIQSHGNRCIYTESFHARQGTALNKFAELTA